MIWISRRNVTEGVVFARMSFPDIRKKFTSTFWITWLLLSLLTAALPADEPRPKYGNHVIRLVDARDFLLQSAAPDYWALMPYYVAQPNDNSCSAATGAMAINALRVHRALGSHDELATSQNIVRCVPADRWQERLTADGTGVTLDELAEHLSKAAEQFHLSEIRIDVSRFDQEDPAAMESLRRLLAENERADTDIVLVNILQSELTGDPEGAVGHFAPVAAFDAARDRVLIFDPDRRWYEPYWVSTASLLKAMDTPDASAGSRRGLIHLRRTTD